MVRSSNSVRLRFSSKSSESRPYEFEYPAKFAHEPKQNMTDLVLSRQLVGRGCTALRDKGLHILPAGFVEKLDKSFEHVPEMVLELRDAAMNKILDRVESIISRIMEKLVDEPGRPLNPRESFDSDPSQDVDQRMKRLDRDLFIALGGPELLVSILHEYCAADQIPNSARDMCSEILITLRELCFTEQSLSSRVISKGLILLLFNLLKVSEVSSSAVGLLEELLAVQPRAFRLSLVPNLHSLLRGLGSRQTAHLCRVLALVVFEPEADRLANDRGLRSLELLQLRRDRVSRPTYTVDINQSILIGMPEMLPRLVSLLRLMNHGPAVDQLASYEMPALLAAQVDTIMLRRAETEVNDWEFLRGLCDRASASTNQDTNLEVTDPAVANNNGDQGGIFRMLSTVGRWIRGGLRQEADRLDLDAALERDVQALEEEMWSNRAEEGEGRENVWGESGEAFRQALSSATPIAAQAELSIHALMLGHHQVEVLFVICTLLGGRRKRDVQLQLAELGIIEVLIDMFPRLSWGAPRAAQPLQRPHGAGCDCDPESALRVQWLRLVHNLVDREGGCPEVRKLALSSTTRRLLNVEKGTPDLEDAESEAWAQEGGLMNLIVTALIKEPNDSPYRFWLASCVEAFLRGSTTREQILIARSGLLENLVSDIIDYDRPPDAESARLNKRRAQGSLQTSFDLLGELAKGSIEVLKMLADNLELSQLPRLLRVMRAHLVDSNVFLRNLVLSLNHCARGENWEHFYPLYGGRSYLVSSWAEVQAVEIPDANGNSGEKRHIFDVKPMSKYEIQKLASAWKLRERNSSKPMEIDSDGEDSEKESNNENDQPVDGEDVWVLSEMHEKGLERLHSFLAKNLTSLTRDLLAVVDSSNINHENICCLNTAVALLVLTRRQKGGDDCVARALNNIRNGITTAARSSLRKFGGCEGSELAQDTVEEPKEAPPRTGHEVLVTFRQLLWFWQEYYAHRGRDRLGIEFNSHISFQEWQSLVELLCADDGSPTSLVSEPVSVPTSPYTRSPRPDRMSTFLYNI